MCYVMNESYLIHPFVSASLGTSCSSNDDCADTSNYECDLDAGVCKGAQNLMPYCI